MNIDNLLMWVFCCCCCFLLFYCSTKSINILKCSIYALLLHLLWNRKMFSVSMLSIFHTLNARLKDFKSIWQIINHNNFISDLETIIELDLFIQSSNQLLNFLLMKNLNNIFTINNFHENDFLCLCVLERVFLKNYKENSTKKKSFLRKLYTKLSCSTKRMHIVLQATLYETFEEISYWTSTNPENHFHTLFPYNFHWKYLRWNLIFHWQKTHQLFSLISCLQKNKSKNQIKW